MEREQIIKALECCASEEYICPQCPIDEKIKDDCECGKLVAKNALALIKELTEENESLTATVKTRGETIEDLQLLMSKVNEDNERLAEENERLRGFNSAKCEDCAGCTSWKCDCANIEAQAKADTVREVRERLTTFFAADDILKYVEVDAEYINEQIDKIAKEMEEKL